MGQNHNKWLPIYYQDYTDKATKAGQTALSQEEWQSKYLGPLNDDTNYEAARGKYEKEFVTALKNKYNEKAKEYANLSGKEYTPYQGSTAFDDIIGAYENLVSQTEYAQETYDERIAKEKELEYEFVMPEEWQTIEDMANETVKSGMPTLDPTLVSSWESKLEPTYAPVREKLKENMASYWASLFPQGGGSSKQAVNNMGQLNDFEMNKFNTALGFAQTDLANQINNYLNAQSQLSGIGQFKAASDQFKSSSDAANYWNQVAQNWTQQKYEMDAAAAQNYYNKQSELAKYLAEIQKPQQADFLTSMTPYLVQAGAQLGSAAIMSSRDYKKEIEDNKIDSIATIKGLDIKNYKYNWEEKQRIGVIAEDTPDILTTDDKKALDVVNMFGVMMDAMQKIISRIEALEAKNA